MHSAGSIGLGYSDTGDDSSAQRFTAVQQIDGTVGDQLREQRPRGQRG